MNKYLKVFWYFSFIIVSCTGASTVSPPAEESLSGNTATDSFSPSSINKIPPEDILREISWSPGAGPGGSDPSICSDASGKPFIRYDPYDTELMNSSGMTTCGWQSGQELQADIIFPNGKVRHEIIYADETGMAEISVTPDNSDPEGIYEYSISDAVSVLKSNAFFRKPIVPRMHYFSDNTIRFYNFPPNETIRLFLYKCTYYVEDGVNYYDCRKWTFIGWQEYQISVNGGLEVKVTEIKDSFYVAVTASGVEISLSESRLPMTIVGEYTQFYESTMEIWRKSQEYLSCPDTAPSVGETIDWGAIIDTNGEGIDLYTRPRTSARIREKLQNETVFRISGDPECSEGNIFWEISVLDDQFEYDGYGYASLADFDGNYYFKPIILGESHKTECGSMTSYLMVGKPGKVVSSDSSNLRLRDKPGVDQNVIELLPEGTPFLVLEGLECIDNTAWWKIHTNTGLEGWAAEYYANEYLLTPIYVESCYGKQDLSHLSIGDIATIATEEGTALRVRTSVNLEESEILFSIPSGVEVSIAEGPRCYGENTIWWRIVTKEGNTGWMAEYQDGVYYLKLVP